MHLSTCGHVQACIHLCWGLKMASHVPQFLCTLFTEAGSYYESGVSNCTQSSQPAYSCNLLCLLNTGITGSGMHAWLLHGFWEIGAVSQLSEASALLTQHVPSSCLNIWNRILLYKPETDTDFVLQHVAELVYRVGVVRCTRVSRKTTQNVL